MYLQKEKKERREEKKEIGCKKEFNFLFKQQSEARSIFFPNPPITPRLPMLNFFSHLPRFYDSKYRSDFCSCSIPASFLSVIWLLKKQL